MTAWTPAKNRRHNGRKENAHAHVRCVQGNEAQARAYTHSAHAGNEICADTTGRAAGRGAYICKSQACLEKAIKIRALERALDKKIDEEVFQRLQKEIGAGGQE